MVPRCLRDSRADLGRLIWIEFDGAFRDLIVFVQWLFHRRSNNGNPRIVIECTPTPAENVTVVRNLKLTDRLIGLVFSASLECWGELRIQAI